MTILAEVCEVTEVRDHPVEDKAHLGVFILNTGAQLIGVNNEDGTRRFDLGDLLIHVKPASTIPKHIINAGFENVKGGKIKASNFATVKSEGIMLNLNREGGSSYWIPDELLMFTQESTAYVTLGDDVTLLLGVTET